MLAIRMALEFPKPPRAVLASRHPVNTMASIPIRAMVARETYLLPTANPIRVNTKIIIQIVI